MTNNEMLKGIERKAIQQTALLYLSVFIVSVAVGVGLVTLTASYDILGYLAAFILAMISLLAIYQLCYLLAEWRFKKAKAKFFNDQE